MNAKSFLKGATLGAMFASVAALLLAPKSGKKTRTDAQKLVNGLMKRLHKEAEALQDVSKERYEEIVSKSVSEYAKGKKMTEAYIDEMKKLLMNSWADVKKELKKK